MYLAKNIKYLRKSKMGLTGPELAKKIGKTGATISDYENSNSDPPLIILIKLCEIFEVDLNSLVFINIEADGISKAIEPDQSNRKIDVLDELCMLRNRLDELQKEVAVIKVNLKL